MHNQGEQTVFEPHKCFTFCGSRIKPWTILLSVNAHQRCGNVALWWKSGVEFHYTVISSYKLCCDVILMSVNPGLPACPTEMSKSPFDTIRFMFPFSLPLLFQECFDVRLKILIWHVKRVLFTSLADVASLSASSSPEVLIQLGTQHNVIHWPSCMNSVAFRRSNPLSAIGSPPQIKTKTPKGFPLPFKNRAHPPHA